MGGFRNNGGLERRRVEKEEIREGKERRSGKKRMREGKWKGRGKWEGENEGEDVIRWVYQRDLLFMTCSLCASFVFHSSGELENICIPFLRGGYQIFVFNSSEGASRYLYSIPQGS